MRVTWPRPIQGWRTLLGEIAIIVVGVLIALGAQQAVEDYKWNRDVAAGREALRNDYVEIVVNARERIGLDRCLRNHLNEVARLLARSPGQTPGIGPFGSPPERPWAPASWGSLVATGVSTHMPRREMLAHARIADSAHQAEARIAEEMLHWSYIYALTGPARPFASGEEAAIRQSLARAMYLLNLSRLQAPQIERQILESGILSAADLREAAIGTEVLRSGPNWRASCAPMAPSSGQLIAAPYDPAIQFDPLHRATAEEAAKLRAR